MGTRKEYLRTVFNAGTAQVIQALSTASTGTPITNYGVTTLVSNTSDVADKAYKLAAPVKGIEKTLIIRSNSTTVITVRSVSTGVVFFPTTGNLITATSGAKAFISLVGLSATEWGIVSRSTGLTVAGSTLD